MGKNFKKTSARDRPKTRKQLRKEKRQLKKVKRNQFYLNKNKIGSLESNKSNESNEKPSVKVQETKKSLSDSHQSKDSSTCTSDRQMKQKQKEMKSFQKFERQMKEQRKRQLLEANENENRIIRSLEKKLKLDKRKNKTTSKSFINEGLDYILEVCDFEQYKDSINFEKELNENVVDFDDDLAVAAGKNASMSKNQKIDSRDEVSDFEDEMSDIHDSDFEDSEDDNEEDEESSDSSDPDEKIIASNTLAEKPKPAKKNPKTKITLDKNEPKKSEKKIDASARMKMLQNFVSKESASLDESDENPDSEDEDMDGSSVESEVVREKKVKFHEDIYGRLRDKDGNIVESNQGKYIPPQMRASLQTSTNENSETIQRLRKVMKGALNRLTENNMHSISTQMEDIYSQHSRNDTNSVLLKLLKESIIAPVLSPERIVIEHAFLISLLHANIGSEIGAFILQNYVEELHRMFDEDVCVDDKRIDNVVLFLCQLYNFKVFHACLIYEILNKFVDKFREKEVELILLVLKNVGFALRKDDPASLKGLILDVQKKSNESDALKESARVRFMLDTLAAVKNNNVLKIQNYDQSYVEHLRKIQKSFLRPGKYVTELKISLEDILNADTKGRWWIVGSAWTGNMPKTQAKESTTNSNANAFDQKILNLAKKHRMNTDTRRNIFCILMSAEDFVDAFEKLVKLGLRGQQYQEIIYVLMHCLLKEKKYNPYYACIAEQFCSTDRKYQLAIQFSTWDKFKEINSFTNQQITSLAKFLAFLFIELKLPLSILKVLQFTEMNKPMVKLIRQIILTILLTDDETVVEEVFSRIAKSEKLFLLREGLQLFLQHFVLKNIEKNGETDESKLEMLSSRVELAVNVMRGSASNL